MLALISAALLLGLDSAVVSFALGACRVDRPRQNRLAAAFGLCDGTASLVGLGLGVTMTDRLEPLGHWGGPLLVAAYAVLVLWTARAANPRRPAWLLYGLPIVMSLDNLAASYALVHTASPLACAAAFGLASGAMSLVGFRAGELAARTVGHARFLGGAALLSAAVTLAVL